MKRIMPFIASLGGVVTDLMTTRIGLSLGLCETHAQYHPILALTIFWGAITMLTLMLKPKKSGLNLPTLAISLYSYLGAINNTLLILGVF